MPVLMTRSRSSNARVTCETLATSPVRDRVSTMLRIISSLVIGGVPSCMHSVLSRSASAILDPLAVQRSGKIRAG